MVNNSEGSAGFKMLDKVLFKGRKGKIVNFRGRDKTKTKKSLYKYDIRFDYDNKVKRNISEYSIDLVKL